MSLSVKPKDASEKGKIKTKLGHFSGKPSLSKTNILLKNYDQLIYIRMIISKLLKRWLQEFY